MTPVLERRTFIVVAAITVLLLAVGIGGALPGPLAAQSPPVAAPVTSGISYQGRLTGPGGVPLNGVYTMRFVVYDAPVAGSSLWDSGSMNVTVEGGLFNVQLGVDQADFDGQALWLSIIVDGQTLLPRQEILPAPYALSLRPGADIVGEDISAADAVVGAYAPATGAALYAGANGGAGLFGDSEESYGVWGASNNSWGGYFTSSGGYGIRVDSAGAEHYDHGAYITSQGGYGVYAQSAQNQGLRGEAGDITGIPAPAGPVGVVGIGANRGAYGASGSGSGLYGVSQGNYGLWAQSTDWRGATGRTSRSDNNYGLYTPNNLYSANYNFSGAIMQVMQNGGAEALSPGDVVAFSGITRDVAAVEGPVVQVSRVAVANSTAVAGVVFSRFNIDAIDPRLESPDDAMAETMAKIEVTPSGPAAPGDFVLVVVQGPAQVRASAISADIQPGDLLSTAGEPGLAARATTINIDGLETTVPGAVFGKALEPLDGSREMIYVYVTLQ